MRNPETIIAIVKKIYIVHLNGYNLYSPLGPLDFRVPDFGAALSLSGIATDVRRFD